MSQAELGRSVGKSRATVHGWENGAHAPRTSDLPDIARVIGVDVSELAALALGLPITALTPDAA